MSIDLPPQAETDSDNGIVLDDRLTDLLDIPSPIQLPPEIETISKDLLLALTGDQPDPQILKVLWTQYSLLFEDFNKMFDEPLRSKLQIFATLHKAIILESTNQEIRSLHELSLAEIQSRNEDMTELTNELSNRIDARIKKLEASPERLILQIRVEINDQNYEQLWDLWIEEGDEEDLINHMYEMFIYEEKDPKIVLREIGILE